MGDKDKPKFEHPPKKRRLFRVSCKNCEHAATIIGKITSDMVRPQLPVCRVTMVLSGLFCGFGLEMNDQQVEKSRELYFMQSLEYYYGRGQRRNSHDLSNPVPLLPVHPKDYCSGFVLRHDYRRRHLRRPWSRYLDPDQE